MRCTMENQICTDHGKRVLLAKMGMIDGVECIVFEKGGKVLGYKKRDDLIRELMTGSYPVYTFPEPCVGTA